MRNNLSKNGWGIEIITSYFNNIKHNNFLRNRMYQAGFIHNLFDDYTTNSWNENYWNRARILPKLILGMWVINLDIPLVIPLIQFDSHPAQEPYDIT